MPRKETARRSSKTKTRSRRISSHILPIHGSLHEDQVGRPMVRFLLNAYSTEQINRMFDEESRSRSQSSSSPPEEHNETSILLEPEPPRAASNRAPDSIISPSSSGTSSHGVFESKITTTSDTPFPRKTEEQVILTTEAVSTPKSQLVHPAENREALVMRQKEFTCGFCAEQEIVVKSTRAHDLRRHMNDTHHSDTLWICPHNDCRKSFEWLGLYKNHMTVFHPKSRLRIRESRSVELCPQTVFACGFDDCEKVFEARSALEAPQTKKRYIDHILNHFRHVESPKCWTFSTRIRNLLRQTDLVGVWPPTELSEEETASLYWDPQTAGVIQKQLETRHLGDRDLLARNVLALGSNPSCEVQLAQTTITLPILMGCSEPMHHKTAAIAPMPVPTSMLTPSPMPTAASIQASVSIAAASSRGVGASLAGPGYMDVSNGAYQQQQPFGFQHPTQDMFNSITVQPQQQQHYIADWSDPMQWINFDGEDNKCLM
ncbi:hypothetical protein GGI35DRAFT_485631 [Trichoderma velutinum]